ncbi:hypothetical protein H7169_02685 [Candidatus Gracilibacteria bacterium]|nr:hypothetical protein [Candidatus Gracilibacteria bacterium]
MARVYSQQINNSLEGIMLIELNKDAVTGKEASQVALDLCKKMQGNLGQMPKNIELVLTSCGRKIFKTDNDAKIFLKFVFKALTGIFPSNNAITVPALRRISEYA